MTRNSKRPLRRVFILGAMAVFLGSCGSPNFTLSKLDRINVSTEFFEVFVSGRVFVSRPYKPYHRDDEGYVQAEYFSPDGTSISCSRFFGKYIASRRHWRVEARGRSHAAFRFWKLNEKPDNSVKGHIPVRYIPKTGYFFNVALLPPNLPRRLDPGRVSKIRQRRLPYTGIAGRGSRQREADVDRHW